MIICEMSRIVGSNDAKSILFIKEDIDRRNCEQKFSVWVTCRYVTILCWLIGHKFVPEVELEFINNLVVKLTSMLKTSDLSVKVCFRLMEDNIQRTCDVFVIHTSFNSQHLNPKGFEELERTRSAFCPGLWKFRPFLVLIFARRSDTRRWLLRLDGTLIYRFKILKETCKPCYSIPTSQKSTGRTKGIWSK